MSEFVKPDPLKEGEFLVYMCHWSDHERDPETDGAIVKMLPWIDMESGHLILTLAKRTLKGEQKASILLNQSQWKKLVEMYHENMG